MLLEWFLGVTFPVDLTYDAFSNHVIYIRIKFGPIKPWLSDYTSQCPCDQYGVYPTLFFVGFVVSVSCLP